MRRCCPNKPSNHGFPSTRLTLDSGLSDRLGQGIQFVYGAYIRHDSSHLAVVVTQTDVARQ